MSIFGEAILKVSIEMLFEKLASSDLLQFARQERIHADLNKWKKILEKIQAVLDDAEEKKVREKSVKIWLGELQNLAYDVEDILDEFATEALRRKLLHVSDQASTSKVRKLIPSCFSSLNPRTIKFNSTMVSQMKKITTRLQDIAMQKDQLSLKMYSGGRSSKVGQRLPTTSLVNEAKVYGREEDQKAIVDLLLRDDLSRDDGVSVIPIVGMGGVGKTTLAQLAYNDLRLEGYFDIKAWVCVSEEFDVSRITKEILLSIGVKDVGDVNTLNILHEELKKQLFKKKFLLILDDIWNENLNDWTVLRRPFEGGSPESKIIITTRNQSVSTIMGTLPAYQLKKLSDEACLCIFAQYSLGRTDFSMHQHLKEIGEKIVHRCKGLPLAAETLGGLLRGKIDFNDWEEVLNSKIWDLPEERSNIIPALKVSYYYLPSHLKRCFAYCSIFPKDFEFSEEEIILLWMAEGLLQQKNNKKHIEFLGKEFFNDLKSRSFFQQSNKDTSRFMMHDLINDLAQWAAGEICFRMDKKLDNNIQYEVSKNNLRYLSYIQNPYDRFKRLPFYEAKLLRTFLPVGLANSCWSFLSLDVLHKLPKLRYLRALSLRGYRIYELPNTIGELKHLRYIDVSFTRIETLPESISTLYNLETLLLNSCSQLKKLCKDIGSLINLRHLNNSDAGALKEMPLRIGNLTSLLTLPKFVVGKGSGSKLGELKSLNQIKESLCISGLENVKALDAQRADLNGKKDLDAIVLKWTSSIGDSGEAENETQVVDMLRPHQNLKELIISGYGGTMFPIWLGDSSFSNLALLTLENCSKCTILPSVGQLPLLKYLVIRAMAGVKSVGQEFYTCTEPFRSLETLCFEHMEEWKNWIPHGPDQEVEVFPQLKELSIMNCPKLVERLPEQLPSLERLVIRSCEQLQVSVPSLSKLCRLEIKGCKQVVQKGNVDLSSLNLVVLSDISSPVSPTELFVQGLSKVELNIIGCNKLTSLWQSRIKMLQDSSSLSRLVIERCPQLLCLVAEEEEEQRHQELPCRLQYLRLEECKCFVKLPQALRSLVFLTEMSIVGCPNLVSFPETCMPPRLRILKIEKCNALQSLPGAWMYSSNSNLERLSVINCDSLTYIVKVQLPPNLKQLKIQSCNNLGTLIAEEGVTIMHQEITNCRNNRNTCILEHLEIGFCQFLTSLWSQSELPDTLEYIDLFYCSNLVSLSSEGNLPKALKYLAVVGCSKLESIGERMQNLTSLDRIEINYLNLKLLPDDLHKLCHLKDITICNCPNVISFPEGGLSSMNLTTLSIRNCKKLEFLPNRMHNLTSLKSLLIENCPSMISIPIYGFPTSLTSLKILDVNICKPLFDWGLHKLVNLSFLRIEGGCPDVASFPLEETGIMLPTSLTCLTIGNFPNLESISSGVQNLTSLETLSLMSCFKLKSFPKEGLPSSLLRLWIWESPVLKQRCEKDKGDYWPLIASIPCIGLDFKLCI